MQIKDNKMLCYRDRTFCASPDCKNLCGRKMTDKEIEERQEFIKNSKNGFALPVAYDYFCGEPLSNP